ncbi:BCCT-family transporter [Escherichia coli]|uniref:BCCT-family transporter n=1 Tax=Escherichia coli TaxID=562 RepID=A0A377B9X4_ECOLX|nr:BCCT-family transporter [Escherichia coli]
MGLVIYLATSKYGNIRLGEGKPEYSTLSWLFMFICAGLGSSTLYWGVAEWAYYYQTPGLNIAPRSQQALEFSVPYSFFHWGISAWATYTLASLIMAYHFHVRKNKGLSLSGIMLLLPAFARKAMGKTGRFDVPDRHCRRTDHFPCCYRSNLYPWAFRADRFTR